MSSGAFFLCIGAQKAGTTWLADYLAAHPEVAVAPSKELHYFDSKFAPEAGDGLRARYWVRRFLRANRASMASPGGFARIAGAFAGMLLYRDASYRRYLEIVRGDRRIAGEITPGYSLLSGQQFDVVDRVLDAPRYLFLLRNPVDRFWSQMRYLNRGVAPEVLLAQVDVALEAPAYRRRSDYDATLTALLGGGRATRTRLIFYETLFDPAGSAGELDGLCDFLGVARRPATPGKVVNPSRSAPLPPETRARIARRLRSAYDRVSALCGDATPAQWRADHALID